MEKTTIDITWDQGGKIKTSISGAVLPAPRNDRLYWVLEPSALFFLSHQYGSMKPTQGLIMSSTIMDMLLENRYVRMPINSALKGAAIDLIYRDGGKAALQFRPKHGMFANSDSLEEGVRQLLNNYVHFAYNLIDEYNCLYFTRLAVIAISVYFDFIQEQLNSHSIGRNKDLWSQSFPLMSSRLTAWLSQKYFVIDVKANKDLEQWAKDEKIFLAEQKTEIGNKRKSIFAEMALT